MIAFLGPNPAIDRTALVETLRLNGILRPVEVLVLPGGKALCAARAARALGAEVAVGLIVGGHAGRWLVAASEGEGLRPVAVECDTETRSTYVVVDEHGRSLAVYEPSGPVSAATFDAFLAMVGAELAPRADWCVLAGSLPRGIDPGAYGALVERCHGAGRPCLVDTGGESLRAAVSARPEVVKVSRDEAESAGFGGHGSGLWRAGEAARALVAMGARFAVVTDGSRGCAASDGHDLWFVEPPRIQARSPIGSGDAFAAGLVTAWAAGRSVEDALVQATAAGAANALCLGAGRLDPTAMASLLPRVRIRQRRICRSFGVSVTTPRRPQGGHDAAP
ncbi:MAG TPA: PfkB family carbohydrate kinase [Candidatus Binatia bacterium]|nr:PfkB family carbohydrate kinase [Candidatus Binatia bacterium]